MAELGVYYITIMPSMKGFAKQVKSQLGDLGSTGGQGFASRFTDVLKGSALGTVLGNLATTAGSAVMGGLKTGIGRLDIIKNFPKVMEGLGYSTSEADTSIQKIMEHLDGLPTSTQDMVTLTQAISDSTGDLDLATRAALGFNDMMLANGASSAEMSTAQGVLNRVLGKGSATVAQWQSLTSVMPAQLGQVARHMLGASASSEDLHAALEDGTVSWNDFLKAIVELDEQGEGAMDSFYQQARNNSVGIGTALENIPNRIGAGWARILEVIGQKDISSTIDRMSYGVRNAMYGIADVIDDLKGRLSENGAFENLSRIMGDLGGRFGGFAQTISGAVRDAIPVVADLIAKGLQWIVDHGQSIAGFVDTIGGAFGKVADVIGGALSAALPALGELVSKGLEWILDHGEVVAALLGGIAAKLVFKGLSGVVDGIFHIAHNFDTLGTVLPHLDGLAELPSLFGYIAAQGGPLSGVFGLLGKNGGLAVNTLGSLENIGPSISAAASSMGGAFSGFGSTLVGVVTGPVGIAVAAIAGIALVLKTLWDNNEGFREAVTQIWDGLMSKFQEAGQGIGEAFGVIGEALGDLGGFFGEVASTFGTYFGGLLGQLGELWKFLCDVLAPGIKTVFDGAARVIGGVVDVVAGVIKGIAGILKGFKTGDWSMFLDGVKTMWSGVWNVLTGPVQAVFKTVGDLLAPFAGTWESFCGDVQRDWAGFCDVVGREWGSLKDSASKAFDAINGEIARNLNDAKTVGTESMAMLGAAIDGDWEGMARHAETVFATVDSSITDHLRAAKDSGIPFVSDLAAGALEKWEWLKTDGVSAFAGLAQGISDKLGEARDWATEKGREIAEFWEGIPDRIWGFFSGIGEKISSAFGSIHFPSPHVDWSYIGIGDLQIPIPNVQWYGTGGVFDSAALIGIGERGREAALPLNRKTYGEIARGIKGEMGGGDGVVVTVSGNTFVVREEADIDLICERIAARMRRERQAKL